MPRVQPFRLFGRFFAAFFAAFLASVLVLVAALSPATAADVPGGVPNIAAASDLKFALEDIAAAFTRSTGRRVKLVFGSSGNFARQIEQGAPFELLLSADESYVERLARAGLTIDGGALYATGRLALFVPAGSKIAADADLSGLRDALDRGTLGRVAIANPDHAPYGRAAREALQRAGLWARVERHLVLGENVAQAAQFALTGGADAAIIAWSLTRAPTFAGKGRSVLLPETMHAPLRQRMVLVKGAGETARAFYAWLLGKDARDTLAKYGFAAPAAATGK